ncbi:MAG TPA: hypothetical protein VNO22_13835 [Planctomycetota bacterium]|nr:hypothetical protein [Planctomycetota bacterium]
MMIRNRPEKDDPQVRFIGSLDEEEAPIFDVEVPPEGILRRWERDILPLLREEAGRMKD